MQVFQEKPLSRKPKSVRLDTLVPGDTFIRTEVIGVRTLYLVVTSPYGSDDSNYYVDLKFNRVVPYGVRADHELVIKVKTKLVVDMEGAQDCLGSILA